jgi:hypothetical protein
MTIRFFTTLMLRPHEEVDGSVVPYLPQCATVEFDGDRPVTAVWSAASGERRVCWYGTDVDRQLRDAHAERYGSEPFWLMHVERSASGSVARVVELDALGNVVIQKRWTFGGRGMPVDEEERSSTGEVLAVRRYRIRDDGIAHRIEETLPPSKETIVHHARTRPAPELSAEPFPIGATVPGTDLRIVEVISENARQGRCRAIVRRDDAWLPAVVTFVALSRSAYAERKPVIAFTAPGLTELVAEGELQHANAPRLEVPLWAIAELTPGTTLLEAVRKAPLDFDDAIAVARHAGEIASAAHERGHPLGGLHPELVFIDRDHTPAKLTGILHRAPALLASTYKGEAQCWPPVFRSDFRATDDVTALAQLLWFMTTGGHPFLADADITWDDAWTHLPARRPQPWRGPPALGQLLSRWLFADDAQRPSLDEVLRELTALRFTSRARTD